MAGGVNFQGTAKPKKVKPKQGPEMPMMEKIRKAAAPMRGNYEAVGKQPPKVSIAGSASGGIGKFPKISSIKVQKSGGGNPGAGASAKVSAKNLTGSDRPTAVPKNTQVATSKAPASGKMSYMPEKGTSVKQRGAVTSSHKPMPSVSQSQMDARMNNQRTIRGKLRDSSR